MRPTPGVARRVTAMSPCTLPAGSSPPSPGFAPCAILIWISSALVRYAAVTPNRPDATCLMADRVALGAPSGAGTSRRSFSPPSPVLDLPPMRFMAMARVVWASREMEP